MSTISSNTPGFSGIPPEPENVPKQKPGKSAGMVESAIKSIMDENLSLHPSINSQKLIAKNFHTSEDEKLEEFSLKIPKEVKRISSEGLNRSSDEEYGTFAIPDVSSDDEEYGTFAMPDVSSDDEEYATFAMPDSSSDDEDHNALEQASEQEQGTTNTLPPNEDEEVKRQSPADRIRKGQQIGKGASGEIVLASFSRDELETIDGFIAKAPPSKMEPKLVAVKQFKDIHDRELTVVKDLREANVGGIPTLYGTVTGNDGKVHTVMKRLNMGNYRSYFNDHLADKKECLDRLIGLMDVVSSFHSAGCCHRDIHEGNIVRHKSKKSEEVQNYLVDFGHAARIGTSAPIGKLPLMLANCPPDIIAAYPLKGGVQADSLKDEDFLDYQQLVDEKAQKIDQFQLGTMIFRVMAATHPLGEVQTNANQIKLMNFLMNKEAEYRQDASKRDEFRPDVIKFLEDEYPNMPMQISVVIAGLLDPNTPIPISRAINLLKRVQFD